MNQGFVRAATAVALVAGSAWGCVEHDGERALTPLAGDRVLAVQTLGPALGRDTDACPVLVSPAAPLDHQRAAAERLKRAADEAALLGEPERARRLATEAASFDATDAELAYHLARASESVGDVAGAREGYCRFLALAPAGADADDARRRLARLDDRARVGSDVDVGTTRPGPVRTARRPTAEPRPRAPIIARPWYRAAGPARVVPVSARGIRGAAARRTARPPAPAPERGPRRRAATGAVVGALAGAAAGAAVDREVRGAVIGAAAGGVLGAIIGETTARWRP